MQTPERTIVLDITKDEDERLEDMKKSMRYEVRRIEKSGITVQMAKDEKVRYPKRLAKYRDRVIASWSP